MNDQPPEDDDRARHMANVGAAIAVLLVLALGYWLTNALIRQSKMEDCLLAHRRTCSAETTPGT